FIQHARIQAERMRWNFARDARSGGDTRRLCFLRTVTRPQPFFHEPLHSALIISPPRYREEIASERGLTNQAIDSYHYDKTRRTMRTIAHIIALLLMVIRSAIWY